MKDIRKAHLTRAGESDFHIGVDFSKVDKKGRMVSGWATIDNEDTEGDIVTAEASMNAFKRARGNLREMHIPNSAVGRVVSYKQEEFTAPDGKTHIGIFVKARVSKGAEDTWQKVLDGTLNGFSIGGNIKESEEILSKSGSVTGRRVLDYDLNELSLVDNPGNQYSDIKSIFKISKSADGSVTSASGLLIDHPSSNLFFCEDCEISQKDEGDEKECPICSASMNLISVVDEGDNEEEIVKSHTQGGGEEMSEKKKDEEEIRQSIGATENTEGDDESAEDTTESETEPTDEVSEVAVDETDSEAINKAIDSLKTDIKEILTSHDNDNKAKIDALQKAVAENHESLKAKIDEIEASYTSIKEDLNVSKGRLQALEGQLRKVNDRGALRKSVDMDDSTDNEQNNSSFWNGAFSVENLL